MSDHTSPTPDHTGAAAVTVSPATERVALGLLAALVAVVLGVALTVAIWRAGYVAAITSLAISFGAAWLYTKAAGAPARKGLAPLIALILAGVALSFFGVVASDLYDAYDLFDLGASGLSRTEFIRDNLFRGDVLSEYGKDFALFAVFAVLGIFGTIRQLLSQR